MNNKFNCKFCKKQIIISELMDEYYESTLDEDIEIVCQNCGAVYNIKCVFEDFIVSRKWKLNNCKEGLKNESN
jgi:transcription elongation factor Elf1